MIKLKPATLSISNKLLRITWRLVWLFLYRPTPRYLHFWRRFLLRIFGAKIGSGAHPYPSASIWAPWNLTMGNNSCISEDVDCYSVDKIYIGENTTVSQYSFLCTASHDYSMLDKPLLTAPIHIGADVWITSDVFVGPGVTIGDKAVILTRSTVLNDIEAVMIAQGNPAVGFKRRLIKKL